MTQVYSELEEERRKHALTQRDLDVANARIAAALAICRNQNRLSGFSGKRDEAWAVAVQVAGALSEP